MEPVARLPAQLSMRAPSTSTVRRSSVFRRSTRTSTSGALSTLTSYLVSNMYGAPSGSIGAFEGLSFLGPPHRQPLALRHSGSAAQEPSAFLSAVSNVVGPRVLPRMTRRDDRRAR